MAPTNIMLKPIDDHYNRCTSAVRPSMPIKHLQTTVLEIVPKPVSSEQNNNARYTFQESARVQIDVAFGVRLLLRQNLDSTFEELLQRICLEQQLNVNNYRLVPVADIVDFDTRDTLRSLPSVRHFSLQQRDPPVSQVHQEDQDSDQSNNIMSETKTKKKNRIRSIFSKKCKSESKELQEEKYTAPVPPQREKTPFTGPMSVDTAPARPSRKSKKACAPNPPSPIIDDKLAKSSVITAGNEIAPVKPARRTPPKTTVELVSGDSIASAHSSPFFAEDNANTATMAEIHKSEEGNCLIDDVQQELDDHEYDELSAKDETPEISDNGSAELAISRRAYTEEENDYRQTIEPAISQEDERALTRLLISEVQKSAEITIDAVTAVAQATNDSEGGALMLECDRLQTMFTEWQRSADEHDKLACALAPISMGRRINLIQRQQALLRQHATVQRCCMDRILKAKLEAVPTTQTTNISSSIEEVTINSNHRRLGADAGIEHTAIERPYNSVELRSKATIHYRPAPLVGTNVETIGDRSSLDSPKSNSLSSQRLSPMRDNNNNNEECNVKKRISIFNQVLSEMPREFGSDYNNHIKVSADQPHQQYRSNNTQSTAIVLANIEDVQANEQLSIEDVDHDGTLTPTTMKLMKKLHKQRAINKSTIELDYPPVDRAVVDYYTLPSIDNSSVIRPSELKKINVAKPMPKTVKTASPLDKYWSTQKRVSFNPITAATRYQTPVYVEQRIQSTNDDGPDTSGVVKPSTLFKQQSHYATPNYMSQSICTSAPKLTRHQSLMSSTDRLTQEYVATSKSSTLVVELNRPAHTLTSSAIHRYKEASNGVPTLRKPLGAPIPPPPPLGSANGPTPQDLVAQMQQVRLKPVRMSFDSHSPSTNGSEGDVGHNALMDAIRQFGGAGVQPAMNERNQLCVTVLLTAVVICTVYCNKASDLQLYINRRLCLCIGKIDCSWGKMFLDEQRALKYLSMRHVPAELCPEFVPAGKEKKALRWAQCFEHPEHCDCAPAHLMDSFDDYMTDVHCHCWRNQQCTWGKIQLSAAEAHKYLENVGDLKKCEQYTENKLLALPNQIKCYEDSENCCENP